MTSATLESRSPSAARLNQRLAARFHQRQTAVLTRAKRVADELGSRYRQIADDLARWGHARGLGGAAALGDALDASLESSRDAMGDALLQAGLDAHATAAGAIVKALPREWVTVFARMAAARIPEATAPDLAPDPWDVVYDWEPIASRAVSRDEALQLIRGMLLPGPAEGEAREWLTLAAPGGMDWEQRLRRWEQPARAAMLNELSMGLGAEENVDQLRARLKPYADGIAWKAQRIARTEANRVAERASQAAYEGMGELVDGVQIVAVMDEWTRPHHAARNGRVYRRGPDGTYRDDAGDPLPDLPDEPNCRCMTIPVLSMPDQFKRDPALRATFETATGQLIPDPASYTDWWQQAGERERMTAVGVRRYQTARQVLGSAPAWADFLHPDGTLLSTDALKSETPAERAYRRTTVDGVLADLKRAFRILASRGYFR